jgi:hypothetical protein
LKGESYILILKEVMQYGEMWGVVGRGENVDWKD